MNLGFVGLGNYAINHQRAVKKNPDLVLVSVYDIVPERAEEAAREFGAKRAPAIEALAGDPDVDGVVITTPNPRHYDDFKICTAHGKHVFVNVPVTTSRAQAVEMMRLAEKHDLTYMAGHNLRRNPAVSHLKKRLDAGDIGTLHSVEASVGGAAAYGLTPDNWRYHIRNAPLLPFAQMAVVFIDLILDIMGAPESIAAFMSKRDGAGESPDLGAVIGRYADGRLSYIGASYVSHLGYEITFAGSEARVTWDSHDENAVTLIGPENRHREAFGRIDEQYEELVEFAHCAQTGATPSVNGMDACNVAAYFEAIAESVNTEQAVRFRSFDE